MFWDRFIAISIALAVIVALIPIFREWVRRGKLVKAFRKRLNLEIEKLARSCHNKQTFINKKFPVESQRPSGLTVTLQEEDKRLWETLRELSKDMGYLNREEMELLYDILKLHLDASFDHRYHKIEFEYISFLKDKSLELLDRLQ
jgi:hypothetical protein